MGEFLPFFKRHGAAEAGGGFVGGDHASGSVDAFENPVVISGNVIVPEVKIANHVCGRNDQAVTLSDEVLYFFVGGEACQAANAVCFAEEGKLADDPFAVFLDDGVVGGFTFLVLFESGQTALGQVRIDCGFGCDFGSGAGVLRLAEFEALAFEIELGFLEFVL